MKMCTAKGLGVTIKKANIISKMDEDILWSKGVLGIQFPEQLLLTVVYVIGLNFALRAGKKHRNLRSISFNSQFPPMYDGRGVHFIHYKEDIGNKTNKGGLKHCKLDPKEVDIYNILGSIRCPMAIIDKYMSLLPSNRTCSAFYLQPLKTFDNVYWYQDSAVGINKLQKVIKLVCERGGLPGFYTNHSLTVTATTHMYHSNLDKQIIQEVSSHRSVAV